MTGIETDTKAIAKLLHEHDALSFWDFAAAGPYVKIEMNAAADEHPLSYKDAVFLSPHKFIGGPGTPGVLVAKRALFQNRVPVVPGGGTVRYVNSEEHCYLDDPEHREEGGTPAIIESIRAGLVFQLKAAVSEDAIRAREEDFIRRAIQSWQKNSNLEILGNRDSRRLSIVSFVVPETFVSDDDAWLDWVEGVFDDFYASPMYRVLFFVTSPTRVLKGGGRLWSQFRRGSKLTRAERAHDAESTSKLVYPPHLFPELACRAFARGIRAALRASGLKNVDVVVERYTSTSAHMRVVR